MKNKFRVVRVEQRFNRLGVRDIHYFVEERRQFLFWIYWARWKAYSWEKPKEFQSLETAVKECDRLNSGIPIMDETVEVVYPTENVNN